MEKEIDFKEVLLAPAVEEKWRDIASQVADTIRHIAKTRAATVNVPDEKAKVNYDGTLTVYMRIPNVIGVFVQIPVGKWKYRG